MSKLPLLPRPLWRRLLPLVLVLLPLLVPSQLDNRYYVGILSRICVYAILVASLDLVVGYIGDVSIGHAGLFAIGAYAVAVLTATPDLNSGAAMQHFPQLGFLPALAVAALLGALAGFLLGFPALRSSGPYLAVITIVYGLILYTIINEQDTVTNGTMGITLEPVRWGKVRLSGPSYFYLVYPALVLSLYVVHNLARSYWGRAFEAIKYSSVAAECCGISRSHYKIAAFVLSAALAAFAGGLFVHLDNYVAPNTFAYNFSVEFLIALIFGGVRSVAGNVIGVALFVILPDVFSGFNDYRLMAYGLLLLVVLYFMPEGLMGVARGVWRRLRPYDPAPELALLAEEAAGLDVFAGARSGAQVREGAALQLEGLEMRFGGLYAVRDLSLQIPRGAVRGLIGPNGSGKSTTVNVLTGLYTPTQGRVVSFGEELNRLRPHERARKGLARTFQNLQLFSDLTVLENVMVGLHPSFRATLWEVALRLPRAKREEREARARAFALLQFVGLEKQALERARNLAYGQARLLEIARALALSPSLLLLDEPAAGLTASEIESINALIRRIKAAGVSILLIEHHMDMVMAISDDVTVLDFGKKIAEGSPRTIQADPGVIQAYLGTHSTATGAPGVTGGAA